MEDYEMNLKETKNNNTELIPLATKNEHEYCMKPHVHNRSYQGSPTKKNFKKDDIKWYNPDDIIDSSDKVKKKLIKACLVS